MLKIQSIVKYISNRIGFEESAKSKIHYLSKFSGLPLIGLGTLMAILAIIFFDLPAIILSIWAIKLGITEIKFGRYVFKTIPLYATNHIMKYH